MFLLITCDFRTRQTHLLQTQPCFFVLFSVHVTLDFARIIKKGTQAQTHDTFTAMKDKSKRLQFMLIFLMYHNEQETYLMKYFQRSIFNYHLQST